LQNGCWRRSRRRAGWIRRARVDGHAPLTDAPPPSDPSREHIKVSRTDRGRRLLWHGLLLLLLGLLTGLLVPSLTNPRMGLSAHLEGVMNGLLLAVLGLAWGRLVLSARAESALFWLAIYGAYANWATTLLGALLATNRRTPIAGAGYGGQPWQENLVEAGLVSLVVAIIAACLLALWGLRRRAE
jgi:(hydroxyamino)benzene mutase